MKRKGQITIFVIIGIVIVALVVLLIFMRGKIYTPATPENLNGIMNDIRDEIEECLIESADDYVTKIGLQGGYLSPSGGSYRLWDDTPISYLCYNQERTEVCTNRMLTVGDMEEQLEEAVEEVFPTCFDLSEVGDVGGAISTFDIIMPDEPQFNVEIAQSSVFVELDFPITLKAKKTGDAVSEEKFSSKIDAPLGELHGVAMDILDAETTIGRFDVLTYVLAKTGRYTIYPHKPYPDKIYQLKMREGNYFFQFAVEGEAS